MLSIILDDDGTLFDDAADQLEMSEKPLDELLEDLMSVINVLTGDDPDVLHQACIVAGVQSPFWR